MTRLCWNVARFSHLAIISVMCLLSGCTTPQHRTVFIKYTPLINTSQIYPPMSAPTPGKIYAVYCILEVKNQEQDALNFTFDVNRLYLAEGTGDLMPGFSWASTAANRSVPAGTTATNLGRVVLRLNTTNQAAWEPLLYKTGLQGNSGLTESVFMAQVPSKPSPLFAQTLQQSTIPSCP